MTAGRPVGPAACREPLSIAAATELLGSLIAIPSINPALKEEQEPEDWYGEKALAEFVLGWLRDIGLKVHLEEVLPGRPNVVSTLKGWGTGHLLWEAHLDTVQVRGMTVPPFEATQKDGKIFGRGAVDDKGCLAAFMLAIAELVRRPPPCDVTLLAAIDEETECRGVLHHLAHNNGYQAGIAGEPTSLQLYSACKGAIRWETEIFGRPAHSSRPDAGVDAISAAFLLIERFRSVAGDLKAHPVLGSPKFLCTAIEGGEGPNTVPSYAKLRFEYRFLPSETGEDAWRRFQSAAETMQRNGSCHAQIKMHPPFINSKAQDVDPAAPIAQAMQSVCRKFNLDDRLMGATFGSDSSTMCHFGVPTLIFGPGSIEQAHAPDEFVDPAQIIEAARMMIELARCWDQH